MARLEVLRAGKAAQFIELTKSQSVSIGSQSFNDIVVSDPSVGPMHCRIIWMLSAYEATAATPAGLDVNGHLIQSRKLEDRDVLRVGNVDVVFHSRRASEPPAPIPVEPAPVRTKSRGETRPSEPVPAEEPSLYEGPVWSDAELPALPQRRGERPPPPPKRSEVLQTIDRELSAGRSRPGEQQAFRSKLVLGLGILAVALIIAAATFAFLVSRQSADKLFARAEEEAGAGQWTTSAASFEEFIKHYPREARRVVAERRIGELEVLREIRGSVPAWERGFSRLQAHMTERRTANDLTEAGPRIAEFAEEIALGAARSAEANESPELLEIAERARILLQRQMTASEQTSTADQRIAAAMLKAERAIVRRKTLEESLAAMRAALAEKDPYLALQIRLDLLTQYPVLSTNKDLAGLVEESMTSALTSIEATPDFELKQLPVSEKPSTSDSSWITPVLVARVRSDQTSEGRVVLGSAADQILAIDSETARPLWKHSVGEAGLPFPSVIPTVDGNDILLFHAGESTLSRIRGLDGQVLWRSRLPSQPRGRPVVYRETIYLVTDQRELLAIDALSGKLVQRLVFPVNLVGEPAIDSDGEGLFVVAESSVVYSLRRTPLEATAVTFTAHAAGSVSVSALPMGALVLLCENDRLESCRLRVLRKESLETPLKEETGIRVQGQVREPPVLRGRQLVLSAGEERLYAFAVADDLGSIALIETGRYQLPSAANLPTNLSLGPDDQFWFQSNGLRRFRQEGNSLAVVSDPIAAGIAVQPLQMAGERYYVGRRPRHSSGVILSQVDRDAMVSPWRVAFGSRVTAWLPAANGGVLTINDQGLLTTLNESVLGRGGFETTSIRELGLPEDMTGGLVACQKSGDGVALWFPLAAQSRVDVFDTTGRVTASHVLKDPASVAPVVHENGIWIPTKEGLTLQGTSGTASVLPWPAPPGGDGKPWAWRSLERADGGVLAISDEGLMIRVDLAKDEPPRLTETARFDGSERVANVHKTAEQIILQLADGTVHLIDPTSLQRVGGRSSEKPARDSWVVGNWLLVQTKDELELWQRGQELLPGWTQPWSEQDIRPTPVIRGESLLIGLGDGRVIAVRLDTGAVLPEASRSLGQKIDRLVEITPGNVFAIGLDGAILRLTAAPTATSPEAPQ